MPTKKEKLTQIKVEDFKLAKIKEILYQGETANIEDRIAAYYLTEELIAGLKALNKENKESIEKTTLADLSKQLSDRGLVEEGEIPEIVIGDNRIVIDLKEKTKTVYNIDTDGLDSLGSIVDSKYKKVVTSLDKKLIEAAWDAGTIAPEMKPYIAVYTKTTTETCRNSKKEAKKETVEA